MSEKPNGEAGSTIEILGDDGLTRRFKFRNGEEIHEFDQLIGGESNGLGATATETFGAVGQEFWCVVEDRLASCRRMFTLFGKPQFDDRPDNSSGNGDAPIYSDLWYAERLGRLCVGAQDARKADGILSEFDLLHIMEIGSLWADWRWRGSFRLPALRGKTVKKGAQRGAAVRKAMLAPVTSQTVIEMARLIDAGHTVKSAAEALARKGTGKSGTANRATWYRYRPVGVRP